MITLNKRRRILHHVTVTAHDDIGLQLPQILGCIQITLLQNTTVPRHHRLVPVLLRRLRIAEQIVPRERDPLTIQIQPQTAAKLSLPRHPVHLQRQSLPLNPLARFDGPVNLHTVKTITVG